MSTITHGNVDYRVVPLENCLDLVKQIQAAGRRWHSHVLSPGCDFNPYDGLYAIVVEDDADGVVYIAPSDGFPEVDKVFVKMLHGDDILDVQATLGENGELARTSALLARVVEINSQGIAWHHHMNFPDCVLNPHRGRWAITVESASGTFSESYEAEPKSVLREIEVLYFRNLANA
ncbi:MULTISPECIES: hypothetical protein [Mesorhizobium]|jgi:hypothetical protein|uniref:Uncharacterized protein n=1 Tax=Rhizobium loti TaxID=381 RepID=A0A6M7U0X8_RHILI|nr:MULTISPECIES: hypothetical protein [Mesorhizobium]KRB31165.1 hypothetical protein ASE05_28275 [Mesorhizobium sp. Root172]OBQ60920.1 hypothetical protein A8145_23740 [Mesorhizobium loti]QKC69998.1 hypothetical protein EB815_13190 [Mesorhizobium loti]